MEATNRGILIGTNWGAVKNWSGDRWDNVKSAVAHLFCVPYSPYDPDEIYNPQFKATFKQLLKEAVDEEKKAFLLIKLDRAIYIEETAENPRLIANPEKQFNKELHQVIHWIYHKQRMNWEVTMIRDEESGQFEAYVEVYITPRKKMEKIRTCCGGCDNFKVDQE
jgi:hypothetical protein